MGFSHFNGATILLLLLLPLAFCSDPNRIICDKDFAGEHPKQRSNVKAVITDLVKRTPASYFAVSSKGVGADEVHGLGWCRPDLPDATCRLCLSRAAKDLHMSCPKSVAARCWRHNHCFLRCSLYNFIGKQDTSFVRVLIHAEQPAEAHRESFKRKVAALMGTLRQKTPMMPHMFAREDAIFHEEKLVFHGISFCSGDLHREGCADCLGTAFASLPSLCESFLRCEFIYENCVFLYDVTKKS